MKVLLIHRDLGTGSVGKIVEDLYFGLKQNGADCKVAFGFINKSQIDKRDLFSVCKPIDVKVHAFLSKLTDRAAFYSRKNTQRLIEFIKEFNPDIIHIHGSYGYWLNIKVLYTFLSSSNIKTIITLHSCWDFTGHCCYFTKVDCNLWKTECKKCPCKKDYPQSLLLDRSTKNYHEKKKLFEAFKELFFIAPSMWMKKIADDSFIGNFKISVIENGIDLGSFKHSCANLDKYGIDSSKIIILGVASAWDERKGLKDFFELSKFVDDSIQIVIVGLTKKQMKTIPKNIVGITKTDSKEELACIYTVATILFNPTYEDNYPTVNLESLACGTPVVTYDVGGSPEIIRRTNCGFIIDKKDYQELIRIAHLPKNSDRASSFLNLISNDLMVKKHITFYEDLLV